MKEGRRGETDGFGRLPPQAFSSLAEAAYEATDAAEDQEEPSTYCLSSSFEIIVQKLLETTDRYGRHPPSRSGGLCRFWVL